jgi:hypothetical protein
MQYHEEKQVIDWLNQVKSPFPIIGGRGGWKTKDVPSRDWWSSWLEAGKRMECVEEVLRRLLRKQDSRVQLTLVTYALGQVGTCESTPELVCAMFSEDFRVRMLAAASLGRVGDSRAIEPLSYIVTHDEDMNVRANACLSLGNLGNASAKVALTRALNDQYEFVVECAKKALTLLEKTEKGRK